MIRPAAPPQSEAPSGSDAQPIPWAAWIDHPGIGATAAAVQAIFREAEGGYPVQQCDLFDDFVEADGHLRNAFEQREQEVAGKPWAVQASGADEDDQLAARLIDFALRRLPLVAAIKHLLLVNRYGYSAIEIDWDLVEFEGRMYVLPVHLALVPARRFRVDRETDQLRLIVDLNKDPVALRPDKWIVARRDANAVVRSGLMRTASWPALWKRFATRNWVITSNRHGVPLPHVTFNRDADAETKAAAKETVKKFGTDGGAATSDDVKIEVHDAPTSSVDMLDRLVAHCDRENSKLVIGSTLTNDNNDGGGGSYAMAEVHGDTKWSNVLFDAEIIQDTIGFGLIEPICRFNNLRARCPLQIQVVRNATTEGMLKAFDVAVENKIPVPVSQFRQVTGWRAPATPSDEVVADGGKAAAKKKPPPPGQAPGDADDAPPENSAADPEPAEPDKAPAAAKSKPASEAKLFQYHLPFVTVGEVRRNWLGLTESFDGDDAIAAEWAAKFMPGGEDAPAPEEPAP